MPLPYRVLRIVRSTSSASESPRSAASKAWLRRSALWLGLGSGRRSGPTTRSLPMTSPIWVKRPNYDADDRRVQSFLPLLGHPLDSGSRAGHGPDASPEGRRLALIE